VNRYKCNLDRLAKDSKNRIDIETHDGELEKTEWCRDGGLVYVSGRNRYLMISSDEVQFRENGLVSQIRREIVQVWQWQSATVTALSHR